ncbi:MAG: hypothetical protein Q4G40_06360, partial [Brachybacterium sp.]|nr:hypothetical protein [Brachybacterium sp.]
MSERGHDDAVREWWSLEGTIPLGGVAEGSSWHRARSADTGDLAALLLVEGPAAQEVADAARRAYLVQNPGLLEILDIQSFEVEDDSGPLTAISYAFPPAPPLAAMLAGGELRAETARTVIGEAARALEVARRRGLRHEHLDSNRIFVDVDKDRVWVLGVGVEAASHRLDHEAPTDGAEAAFADVAALGRLLYRSMTGVAPHADDQGRLIPPSAATARRVPADLDELCVLILTGAPQAPGTVRDLISELGAWQSLPVTLEAYDPHDAGRGDTRGDGDVPADDDAADTVQNDTDGGAVDAAAPDEERPDQPDQPEETRVHDVAPGVGGAIVGGGAVAGAAAAV